MPPHTDDKKISIYIRVFWRFIDSFMDESDSTQVEQDDVLIGSDCMTLSVML